MMHYLGDLGSRSSRNKGGIYYISDIHLDHKIYKKFGKKGNKKKVEKFIHSIAEQLLLDDDGNCITFPHFGSATVVIIGDTSHSFEITKMFYRHLSQQLPYYKDIFVILGNHELWEFDSPEEAIEAYQKFFDSLPNIHLLHNSLYLSNPHLQEQEEIKKLEQKRWSIINDKTLSQEYREKASKDNFEKLERLKRFYYGNSKEEQHKNRVKRAIITQDRLKKMTIEEIRTSCFDSRTILFGTIGYAAYNPTHNVSIGIYRNSITTKEEEKRLSKEAEDIYTKLTQALPENRLIIASHMNLKDWSKTPYIKKWQYFSGHTHINKKILLGDISEYSNNQIGYYGKRVKFKAIAIDEKIDYFAYYNDGIYRISDSEYRMFYSGFSKSLSSIDKRGCENSGIIMLKHNGMYLFLIEKDTTGQLYLLEGGKRKILEYGGV